MTAAQSDDLGISLSGPLTLKTIGALPPDIRALIAAHPHPSLRAELSQISQLDTSGVVFLRGLPAIARSLGKDLDLTGLPERLQPFFDFVTPPSPSTPPTPPKTTVLEKLGDRLDRAYAETAGFLYLTADLTVFSVQSLYRRGGIRKGSFIEQSHGKNLQRRVFGQGLTNLLLYTIRDAIRLFHLFPCVVV